MLSYTVPQFVPIDEDNAADFAAEINKAVVNLAQYNPEIIIDNKQPFTAYVKYMQNINIADSVKDEYHADGLYFTCAQCPLHEIETDGRKKTVPCKYADLAYTRLNNEACEVFYRRLMLRDIEPKGEPHSYSENKTNYFEKRRQYLAARQGQQTQPPEQQQGNLEIL